MAKTEAQIRANSKFESKAYDKITVRLRKDRLDDSGLSRESITKAAEAEGMSLNAFILQAVAEKINKK
ncbi:MAG: antitoxin [Lachnospiraceae bacterium]|nr:antitoxin [Lachnospiraceae bacterium]